ncbi:MAG: heavy metal translocating P-type ATPase [Brevinema sp.]
MSGSCCNQNSSEKKEHSHDHDHDHSSNGNHFDIFIGIVALLGGGLLDHFVPAFKPFDLAWYALAYIIVTWVVFKETLVLLKNKDFFNELTLMILATVGAFYIGEYPEGLGVMVFYRVGEYFQALAVRKTKTNISDLLDMRPEVVSLVTENGLKSVHPQEVRIGDVIEIKAGERIALDGVLSSEETFVDSVALTGESLPQHIYKGQEILSGMIPVDHVIRIQISKSYENSTLSRILDLVQESSKNKAPAEELIRRLARYYTPTVFFAALLLVTVPFFLDPNYVFNDWLYRSLVFLVISCPCAFVISIPLTFFSGIGVAARNGLLFKGGNYLDMVASVKMILTDKTGTMTKGKLSLQKINTDMDQQKFLSYLASLEQKSNHPIAKSILTYAEEHKVEFLDLDNVQEIMGRGILGTYNGQEILAGTYLFLKERQVTKLAEQDSYDVIATPIFVAVNGEFAGYVEVLDEVRETAKEFVANCHKLGIRVAMLSGDRKKIVEHTAKDLGIDEFYGELLPDQKIETAFKIKEKNEKQITAFLGDGLNDAPILAISDLGVAMGGFGSELAIETADLVIQNDDPMKLIKAIEISKATSAVAWQNIIFALLVKLIFLTLGAFGLTSMWMAVFSDVGVSTIAVLNALRLQYHK